jgi:hypothetical protein
VIRIDGLVCLTEYKWELVASVIGFMSLGQFLAFVSIFLIPRLMVILRRWAFVPGRNSSKLTFAPLHSCVSLC